MTMLYHAIVNTIADAINVTYARRMMGRMNAIPSRDTLAWLVVDHRSRVFAYDRLAAFCVVTTSTIKKEQAV